VKAPVSAVRTAVYRFPTPTPEADGTFAWEATTVVTVEVDAGGRTGLGWTYSTAAAASVVGDTLAPRLDGGDPFDVPGLADAMHRAGRNVGTRGLYAQAQSAVDIALWDLKARLLDIGLADLLGRVRDRVPVYGSGGFTTFSEAQLAEQVDGWLESGCRAVKIKIGESWGTRPRRDLARVCRLRELTGPDVDLMVDANGGYSPGQARRTGLLLDELGVVWFEEPVSSDDTDDLRLQRSTPRSSPARAAPRRVVRRPRPAGAAARGRRAGGGRRAHDGAGGARSRHDNASGGDGVAGRLRRPHRPGDDQPSAATRAYSARRRSASAAARAANSASSTTGMPAAASTARSGSGGTPIPRRTADVRSTAVR
jgi:hypothetical protein